jgi:tyrosyl-tRNA synthetase
MVGDLPESQPNVVLDEKILQNQDKNRAEKFLDFDCGDNSATMVNNYDWFKIWFSTAE